MPPILLCSLPAVSLEPCNQGAIICRNNVWYHRARRIKSMCKSLEAKLYDHCGILLPYRRHWRGVGRLCSRPYRRGADVSSRHGCRSRRLGSFLMRRGGGLVVLDDLLRDCLPGPGGDGRESLHLLNVPVLEVILVLLLNGNLPRATSVGRGAAAAAGVRRAGAAGR